MSVDVSPTENPSSASLAVPPTDASNLFTAYDKEGRAQKGRWAAALVAAIIPVTLAVGFWVLAREEAVTFRVVTPHGFKSITGGMTSDQVVALLGRPMTREQDATGADCYRHGTPSMEKEFFLVYSVCYQDGKLRDVKQQKYSAWNVDPATGSFQPPATDTPPAQEAVPSGTAG
ncbi:hypothetical protein MYSTI_00051 [Myxococcus stipitatus DSM 14675]|uniref:Lipoprotein SmpA/OmlA domain-containing protein n=1 Tax=Myxococcus stipitatus (strain DSM 14675 / JCM 12634 / Mx s8) TaxID=1278073 RepID=L7U0K8_MYXSD|nr:hypothetical protein [Myxococcus stipitatus]AGC41410.1 hypothetical protein MYSTI_00051 [Myxococcus stipitatus DSM 14675]